MAFDKAGAAITPAAAFGTASTVATGGAAATSAALLTGAANAKGEFLRDMETSSFVSRHAVGGGAVRVYDG